MSHTQDKDCIQQRGNRAFTHIMVITLLPLLLLLSPSSSTWTHLTPADYHLAANLDPRDHLDLYPGTGGPRVGTVQGTQSPSPSPVPALVPVSMSPAQAMPAWAGFGRSGPEARFPTDWTQGSAPQTALSSLPPWQSWRS